MYYNDKSYRAVFLRANARLNMAGQVMYSDVWAISTETLLRVVADPKRRAILEHLRTIDNGAVAVETLSKASVSHGRPDDSQDQRSRMAIELRHTHLPMLADANLISYDREHETVTYRGDERAEALLAFITERLE